MTFTAYNTKRLTANALKESITAYLASRDPSGIIGSEVMYGSSRRVADMVFISNGHSYAIEIKSEFDSTARLEGQFDSSYSFLHHIAFNENAISKLISLSLFKYCFQASS